MREELRFDGKNLGARIRFRAGRWFISIPVEMPDAVPEARTGIVGVDLGIKVLMTGSDGMIIANYAPRRRLLKRQKKLQRRIARQRQNSRQEQRGARLARLHYRISCIRQDAVHKATTKISRAFGAIVLEDLYVAGMGKNHVLAGAVADAAFGEIRQQFQYKAERVIHADRFFPSSKTCSVCGAVKEEMSLAMRVSSAIIVDR
jgi:putative transposase